MPTSGKSFKRFFQRNVNFSTTCVNRDELLDQENRMAAERLAAKVASLKSVSLFVLRLIIIYSCFGWVLFNFTAATLDHF